MRNTINFNSAAANLFAGNPKLRVRTRDGRVEIRPTDRKLASNLPEGETLRTVAYKRKGERVSGAVLSMKNIGEHGTRYDMVEGKHGWYVLVATTAEGAKGAPLGKVSVSL